MRRRSSRLRAAAASLVATVAVAASPAAAAAGGSGDVEVGPFDLPAGSTVVLAFDARIASPLPSGTGSVCNQATAESAVGAAAPSDDPDTAAAVDPTCTPLDVEADLAVAVAAAPDPAVAGNDLTYTVTVLNQGPIGALGVSMASTLPAGVGFVSAVGAGWSCGETGGVVTCTRPALEIGAAPPIALTVAVPPEAAGPLVHRAVVSALEADPNPADNEALTATAVGQRADLSIAKSDLEDPPTGGVAVYTLDVGNSGPSRASAVVVTDTLPTGLSYSSATGAGWSCAESAGVVTCTRPFLDPGPAPAITLTATIDPAPPGQVTNLAAVASAATDPQAANDDAEEETTLDTTPPAVTAVMAGAPLAFDCTTTPPGVVDGVEVAFSEPVAGAGEPSAYRLVASGATPDLETTDCTAVAGNDAEVPLTAVVYDPLAETSTLAFPALTAGRYRLLVCDEVSDLTGNALDGGDFAVDLRSDPDNLLVNGHFDCSLEGWTPSPAAGFAWSGLGDPADDADGATQSGSGRLVMPVAPLNELAQCVAVPPAAELTLSARVRLEPVPTALVSYAQLCDFFDGAGCTGSSLGVAGSASILSGAAPWTDLTSTLAVPAGAAAARCSLIFETLDDPLYTGRVDAVTLAGPRLLFADGFESGDLSRWSGATP